MEWQKRQDTIEGSNIATKSKTIIMSMRVRIMQVLILLWNENMAQTMDTIKITKIYEL